MISLNGKKYDLEDDLYNLAGWTWLCFSKKNYQNVLSAWYYKQINY